MIILDRNSPDLEGLALLRNHRQQGKHTPDLCLTGKRSIEEKLDGFRESAGDYLTKPFHIKELLERVSALLKRQTEIEEAKLEVGLLKFVPQCHAVVRDGLEIALVGR